MFFRLRALNHTGAVTNEPERTLRGDFRIELLERTGGGVAWIGEERADLLLRRARHSVSRNRPCA